jgi:hypothetical protein
MTAIFWVRLGFLCICAGVLALLVSKHEQVTRALKQFFLEPTSAVNLGLLRIAVFFLLFERSLTNPASWFASLSPEFVTLPRGWQWLSEVYPLLLRGTHPLERLFVLTSALATIGLFTRYTTALSSLLAVWLLGIPNFYFKIGHDTHVMALSALILACSPAGDGVSIDALLQRYYGAPRPAPSVAYTAPIRFSWLLLGTSYLFPGLWKLWETGDLWLTGAKLRVDLFSKWAQLPDYAPAFRIDHHPLWLAILGTLTLVFEIGFSFALFTRQSRVIAGLAAAGFHLGIGLSMDIWFVIWFPLIVLIDLPEVLTVAPFSWVAPPITRAYGALSARLAELLPRLRYADSSPRMPRPPAASTTVGSLLLLGMLIAGFAPIDSWPISVYPRFSDRTLAPPRVSSSVLFVAQPPHEKPRELKIQFLPFSDSAGVFRVVRSAIGLKKRNRKAFDEYIALITRIVRENSPPLPVGTRLFIYSYDFRVDPAERTHEPPQRALLAETRLR